MGTIVIEAYRKSGTANDSYVPVSNLGEIYNRTKDATTSTTPESFALGAEVVLLRVYTDVAHRLGLSSAQVGDSGDYFTTPEAVWFDIAVPKGSTLYYRIDA
jgi:hypothetical protein